MNKNIEIIIKVCEELGVNYETHHPTNNLVFIDIGSKKHIFVNWTTPLNPHSTVQLCQDKGYFYSYLNDVVRMPKTLAFLTPYCDEKYIQYLDEKTIYEIIQKSESEISYPAIVKKNRGTLGANVFFAKDRRGLEQGLIDIFNKNSSDFDYVGLVQEYIDIEEEYRAVFIDSEYVFCYRKAIEDATYSGNLSRLHWEGAFAELTSDSKLISEISRFYRPMFEKIKIPFCGLDIAVDKNGELFLIEANSAPGFNYILDNGGEAQVKNMYIKMIKYLTPKKSISPN